MPDTFTPPITPSAERTSKTIKAKVLKNDFGDGYQQRLADGINTRRQEWSLVWSKLPLADLQTIETFFETQAGYLAFYWTPPGEGSPRLFTCEEWQVTWGAVVHSMQAILKEAFDPT